MQDFFFLVYSACMNFFSLNFPLHEFFFCTSPAPPHNFSNGPSLNSLYFPLKEIAVVARHVCRDKFIGADGSTHRSTYRISGSTSGSLGLTQTHSTHALF